MTNGGMHPGSAAPLGRLTVTPGRFDLRPETLVPTRPLITRPRLEHVLAERWTRRLTAIVAGPGLGKTSLALQAVGVSTADDIDIWVRCTKADADAFGLARHLAECLVPAGDRELTPGAEPATLAAAIADLVLLQAPKRVCLAFDDLHELGDESSATQLIGALLDVLPANGHVLVASRTIGAIGLTRLVTLGHAVVLRDHELRFTDAELATFAALRGVADERLGAAQGWPALAELLATEGVAPDEFVYEQALQGLDDERRAALVAIAAAGGSDSQLLDRLVAETNIESVVEGLPLIVAGRSGWYELHPLLADAVLWNVAEETVAELRARAGVAWADRGEADRAVRLLAAAGARDELVSLLRTTLVAIDHPAEPGTVGAWTAVIPGDLDSEPVVLLLRTIALGVSDLEAAWTAGTQAVEAFAAAGDVDGEIAALARLTGIAYNTNPLRFLPYVGRVRELADQAHPAAQVVLAICDATAALVAGDPITAVAVLQPVAALPDASQIASFLLARALLNLGRANEALAVADRVSARVHGNTIAGFASIRATAAFLQGDVDQARTLIAQGLERFASASSRQFDRDHARASAACGLAHLGDLDEARAMLAELRGSSHQLTEGGLAFLSLTEAYLAVLDGDEARAATIAAAIEGLIPPPLDGIALLYVLRPDIRAHYDDTPFEGPRALQRAASAALVAARSGDLSPCAALDWTFAGALRIAFPPSWLTELTAFAAAAGNPPPTELLTELDVTSTAALTALASATGPVGQAAARQLATLPRAPQSRLEIRVLGPIEVAGGRDSSGGDAKELRRERVRTLLSLLVLRRSVARDAIQDLMWRDLDPAAAANNLRVTLARLRRALEPGRDPSSPSSVLRSDLGIVSLAIGSQLECDLWRFDDAVRAAREAERSGHAGSALQHLLVAVSEYRDEPFPGVHDIEEIEIERLRIERDYVRSAVRAAELLTAYARHPDAIETARRALRVDRWCVPAYDTIVSAHAALGENDEAQAAAEARRRALSEII
jgi:LuxR family maltose regulon positive regulatory protein